MAFWKQGKRFRREQGIPSESSSHVSTEKGTPGGSSHRAGVCFSSENIGMKQVALESRGLQTGLTKGVGGTSR